MSYYVEHNTVALPLVRSASRPWIVMERYHHSYKQGMVTRIVDRYETREQAMRRARDLNKR